MSERYKVKADTTLKMKKLNHISRNLRILILFLVLGYSCQSNHEEIYGIWLGTYAENNVGSGGLMKGPLYHLLDIDQDSVRVKKFQDLNGDISLKSFTYEIHGDDLIYNNDTFIIKRVTTDTLELGHGNGSLVYSKLIEDDYKVGDIHLELGIYRFFSNSVEDTIYLWNADTLFNFSENTYLDKTWNTWRIDTYKKFQFFVIDRAYYPPFLIESVEKEHLNLKCFSTDPNFLYFQLIKLADLDYRDSNLKSQSATNIFNPISD